MSDTFKGATRGFIIPDGWEIAHGINVVEGGVTVDHSGEDPDGDGLNNFDEYMQGTDPQKWDTDDDGVSDGVEMYLGSQPLYPDAPPFIMYRSYTWTQVYQPEELPRVSNEYQFEYGVGWTNIDLYSFSPGYFDKYTTIFPWNNETEDLGEGTTYLLQYFEDESNILYSDSYPAEIETFFLSPDPIYQGDEMGTPVYLQRSTFNTRVDIVTRNRNFESDHMVLA